MTAVGIYCNTVRKSEAYALRVTHAETDRKTDRIADQSKGKTDQLNVKYLSLI